MNDTINKTGLAYVLQDMTDAQADMTRASVRLQACTLPNFKECPAGGEEFHAAMAEMSHAQTDGIQALLQWQTMLVKREMAKGTRDETQADPVSFKTKYFSATGVAAMGPVALLAIAVIAYVIVQAHKIGGVQ